MKVKMVKLQNGESNYSFQNDKCPLDPAIPSLKIYPSDILFHTYEIMYLQGLLFLSF